MSTDKKTDATTTVSELRDLLRVFVAERNWEKFHSPKNLAMSIGIEAAELMEHFQWLEVVESRAAKDDPTELAAIGEELADVLAYVLAMANALDIDVSETLRAKMKKNAIKYPAG
jgi:NTP pyrophosphatase (non-canonical NTP hydrolase)